MILSLHLEIQRPDRASIEERDNQVVPVEEGENILCGTSFGFALLYSKS